MPIMDAKGVELKREPGALSLRLAAVYRKENQTLQDFMEELKALTQQDKEDFRAWFTEAGYPVK